MSWAFLVLAITDVRADDRPVTAPPVPGEVTVPLGLPPEAASIQIVQRLNEQTPPDLVFRDDAGRTVRLGDYFGPRPVILVLAYNKCPMLCNQVLNGLLEGVRPLQFTPGQEFELVVVSFHPAETPEQAAARKALFLQQYGRRASADGVHFLTGEPHSIDALCEAVGFGKFYDAKRDEFIHASGIMILTPQGKLSRYLLGIRYPPRDLRLALVEASEERIGTLADRFVLLCFHYDPASGQYTVAVLNLVRLGGVVTVLGLIGFMVFARRKTRPEEAAP